MKAIIVAIVTALLLASASGEDALLHEKRLRTMSKVHSNPLVFVNGEEKRAKRHGHCADGGDRTEAPVCASNGKKYLNIDVLNYNKCVIKAEFGEIIEVVSMDICADADMEDAEHEDSDDIVIFVVAATALLLACSCGVTSVAALDREKKLRVVSTVHANERVLVSGQENRERSHGHCLDDGTRNQDPVCGSNGKKYLNMNRFLYNQCLIKAEDEEDIDIVDLEFCRDAMLEDLKSEGIV
ncbi:hypothetical protein BBO99_00004423 [Phytophthora kernoviae]|uniref:Kazal-like domain-containing protein n=2 Tax=Phytophthora kernoviae TaxID=325452 RepID=A0A3R7IEM8_9STRA|nr:hypothetical protein G195_008109 [Phytophthora kernoviae 00238/432]KAG2521133.1 hypothetical protein JM16_006387 [Phytophthora kernoviae]KAG2522245.1 hypothetical protein JM18_006241 [Phytophthora kernoviae]RLM97639.1 hypothetical protein BBI17_008905 [Phytophthora kernoviae]RLN80536.1 hypothetical protein BBO99_00004423 [Phytophthora kernoviae]